MSRPVDEWLKVLGLPAGHEVLFQEALTHSSADSPTNYERLEFLGDAVLKIAISEWVFTRFPEMPEGTMTKVRGRLVSDVTLAQIARRHDLGAFLRLGAAERRSGGADKVGTLASSLEATLAATYLAHGLPAVTALIRTWWEEDLVATASAPGAENAKAQLQEITQERWGILPTYRVVGGEGPQHRYVFHVAVDVDGRTLGQGRGTSKRQAEQMAAAEALKALETTA